MPPHPEHLRVRVGCLLESTLLPFSLLYCAEGNPNCQAAIGEQSKFDSGLLSNAHTYTRSERSEYVSSRVPEGTARTSGAKRHLHLQLHMISDYMCHK